MRAEAHLRLEALRRAYAESLPGRLMFIEQQWHKLKQHFNKEHCADLHRGVHALSGSAGVYGYNELGLACRDLSIYLQQLLDEQDLNTIQKSEIAHLLEQIKNTQPARKDKKAYCIPKKDISSKKILYPGPDHECL